MTLTVIEKCYPNAHGWLKLLRGKGDDEGFWFVREPDALDRDDYTEHDTETSARQHYEDAKRDWMDTPNWEAQARYDEEHGTDNGYAPWQRDRDY